MLDGGYEGMLIGFTYLF